MNYELLASLPILDIGERENTQSEMIDFIKPDELTHPVMTGLDKYQRRFITIKFKVGRESLTLHQTFFERYTHNQLDWVGASSASSGLIWTEPSLTSEQFEFINQIISGNKVTISEEHRPVSSVLLGELASI